MLDPVNARGLSTASASYSPRRLGVRLSLLGGFAVILFSLFPCSVEAQILDRIKESYREHKERADSTLEEAAVRTADSTFEMMNRGVEAGVGAADRMVDTGLNRIEDAISRAFEGGKGDADAFAKALASGSLVLGGIEYAPNSDALSPSSRQVLEDLAKAVRATPGTFLIEGHTDPVGDPAVMQDLSKRRADAVKKLLVAEGVAASRLFAVGHGASRPPAPATDGSADAASPARIELTRISS